MWTGNFIPYTSALWNITCNFVVLNVNIHQTCGHIRRQWVSKNVPSVLFSDAVIFAVDINTERKSRALQRYGKTLLAHCTVNIKVTENIKRGFFDVHERNSTFTGGQLNLHQNM